MAVYWMAMEANASSTIDFQEHCMVEQMHQESIILSAKHGVKDRKTQDTFRLLDFLALSSLSLYIFFSFGMLSVDLYTMIVNNIVLSNTFLILVFVHQITTNKTQRLVK